MLDGINIREICCYLENNTSFYLPKTLTIYDFITHKKEGTYNFCVSLISLANFLNNEHTCLTLLADFKSDKKSIIQIHSVMILYAE